MIQKDFFERSSFQDKGSIYYLTNAIIPSGSLEHYVIVHDVL